MDVKETVIEGLKKVVKGKEVTENSDLKSLGLDSLDVVDLLMDIEDTYHIEFSNEEMMSFTTVNDIVNAIEKKK